MRTFTTTSEFSGCIPASMHVRRVCLCVITLANKTVAMVLFEKNIAKRKCIGRRRSVWPTERQTERNSHREGLWIYSHPAEDVCVCVGDSSSMCTEPDPDRRLPNLVYSSDILDVTKPTRQPPVNITAAQNHFQMVIWQHVCGRLVF